MMEPGNDLDFLVGEKYIVIFILPLVGSLKQTVSDVTLADIFSTYLSTFERVCEVRRLLSLG